MGPYCNLCNVEVFIVVQKTTPKVGDLPIIRAHDTWVGNSDRAWLSGSSAPHGISYSADLE